MRSIKQQVVVGLLAAAVLAPCSVARAQSLSDRIGHYHKRQQSQQANRARQEQAQLRNVVRRLNSVIGPVDLDGVPAREAFTWWSRTTGVQLVINWNAMANEGIDPDTPIRLKVDRIGATTALELLLEQTAQDQQPLIHEVKPWYVRIMTRLAALRHPVTKVYYIGDLLIRIPNFNDAPSLGVSSSLGGDGDGGGSGNDNDNGNGDDDDDDERLSSADSAEQIAQLIRDTIEPDIWIANGGEFASITYFQQRLVVRAPMFVQRQIGRVAGPGGARSSAGAYRGVVRRPRPVTGGPPLPQRESRRGVSGVQSGKSVSVSGVEGKR